MSGISDLLKLGVDGVENELNDLRGLLEEKEDLDPGIKSALDRMDARIRSANELIDGVSEITGDTVDLLTELLKKTFENKNEGEIRGLHTDVRSINSRLGNMETTLRKLVEAQSKTTTPASGPTS